MRRCRYGLDNHCRPRPELVLWWFSHSYRTRRWFVDRREAELVEKLSSSSPAASRYILEHANATAASFLNPRDNKDSRKGRHSSDFHRGWRGREECVAMELQGCLHNSRYGDNPPRSLLQKTVPVRHKPSNHSSTVREDPQPNLHAHHGLF